MSDPLPHEADTKLTRGGAGRWALDWAFIGGATAAIAPLSAQWLPGGALIPDGYGRAAALFGVISGLLVGVVLRGLYGMVPRGRVAVLGVLLPVPLGIWGALVAWAAACLTAPNLTMEAFLMGLASAVLQMAWLVPAYMAAVDRGWRLIPTLLSAIFAPVGALLGTLFVLLFFDWVRFW